jgi:hypothetical protein
MSRSWRRVAEFSENENFGGDDMCAAIHSALDATCRAEVPQSVINGVREMFLEREPALFADMRIASGEAHAPDTQGHGVGRLMTDHAHCVLREGMVGEAGLTEALSRTLNDYLARAVRQIEEHCRRSASGLLTKQVRGRLEKAVAQFDTSGLAKQLAGCAGNSGDTRLKKHTELDDGVPI